ncbi:MAG: YdeI/OmpD-associated family protein [Anaerolineales bacterium]|nr:YdeI/OmpD-associated family protein [Anaerolineales bacterium]
MLSWCHLLPQFSGSFQFFPADLLTDNDVFLSHDLIVSLTRLLLSPIEKLPLPIGRGLGGRSCLATHQKEYITWIEEAKRADTRQRRIAKTIEMLKEGKKGR